MFIENVALYGTTGPVPDGDHRVPLGTADVKRPGRDVTVVTYGRTVRDALAAAERAGRRGRSTSRWWTCAAWSRSTRHRAGLGGADRAGPSWPTTPPGSADSVPRWPALINEELFGELDAPVARVGARFAPIGSAPVLEADRTAVSTSIADAVRHVVAH